MVFSQFLEVSISALLFKYLCIILSGFTFAGEILERERQELFQKDPVGAWQRYCSQFEIGTVDPPELINELPEKERAAAEAELTKARQLVRNLRILVEQCLEKERLSRKEKIALMEQLMLLRKKVQHTDQPGLGNLMLSSAISKIFIGLFFQVYQKQDAADHKLLRELLFQPDRCCEENWTIRAFIRAKWASEKDKELSLYRVLLKIAEIPSRHIESHNFSAIGAILQEFERTPEKMLMRYETLLTAPDKRCVTWELLIATRLVVIGKVGFHFLSEICPKIEEMSEKYEETQEKNEEWFLEKFAKLLIGPFSHLSTFEKEIISVNGKKKTEIEEVEKMMDFCKEAERHFERGYSILWSIYLQLDGSGEKLQNTIETEDSLRGRAK